MARFCRLALKIFPACKPGVSYWLLPEAANPNGFLLDYETVNGIISHLAAQFSPTGSWINEGTRGTLAFDVVVTSSVPEPSPWILVAMGGAALMKFRLGQKTRRGKVSADTPLFF